MPRGWTNKDERQYEHIKESELEGGAVSASLTSAAKLTTSPGSLTAWKDGGEAPEEPVGRRRCAAARRRRRAGRVAWLGCLTRLDALAETAAGPPQADRPVVIDQIPALGVARPVYPSGPLTLRVPLANHAALPSILAARLSSMVRSRSG